MPCKSCRGTGWIVQEKETGDFVSPCPECSKAMRATNSLGRANIPQRYSDRGFELYSFHHRSQETALTKAVDYVEAYPRVERGILFCGPCGVGKTHLAVAILRSLISEKGVRARFADEAELLRRLQYSYGPDSPDTEREVLSPLMQAELLVWDDLGTGRPTDWVRETIQMLINYRYTNRKQTIITTNWPLQRSESPGSSGRKGGSTLEERIGIRLFSRIMEMCEVVDIQGPDARTAIHKAGMDFKNRSSSFKIPSLLIICPNCDSRRVKKLDQSDTKRTAAGEYLDVSCLCEDCSEHFLARFYPRTAAVKYPSL